jgi:hypothetical protein
MPKRHFAIEEVKDERNIDIPIMVLERLLMLREELFLGKQ